MTDRTGPAAACPIARALAVVGEKWALLIVRDALAGVTRFADFRASLGIAPDMLADRLGKLVDHGVLERRSYREPGERARDEYVITDAGRALAPGLAALAGWGVEHLPVGRPSPFRFVDATSGRALRAALTGPDDRPVALADVRLDRVGPHTGATGGR
ncbi:winged helix-turn-helix transcriptional regulator [Nakamurella sp.]|uniref:winged helix-turn-helix transcriptional regulator n=1 Tax=Nakamurella sp. TaxID=1869182 RepID=UPI003B3A976D